MLRRTKYNYVPTPTESSGSGELWLPFWHLWRQAEKRFYEAVARALAERTADFDMDRSLETARLGRSSLALDPWFSHLERPPGVDPPRCRRDLDRLARQAHDYTDDDGTWTAWRDDMQRAAAAAVEELTRRIDCAVAKTFGQFGLRAAGQLLEHLRTAMHGQIEAWQQEELAFGPDRSAEVRSAADELRGLAEPHQAVWRLWVSLRPNTPLRWWQNGSQQARLTRLVDSIRFAQRARYQRDLRQHRLAVLRPFLASAEGAGHLDLLQRRLERYGQFFEHLFEQADPNVSAPRSSTTELLLVEDIDTVVDPDTGETLGDVYVRQIARAGCTAKALADRLWREGLSIGSRRYQPHEWPDCPPHQIQAALVAAVRQYLGSDDPHVKPDVKRPTTAAEHAATVSLAHPALRHLLKARIAEWARCSRPYAQFDPIAGAEPTVNRYLYCYPPDRRLFEHLLSTEARPVSAGNDPSQYAVNHPFVALLVQFAFGYPGHAQPLFLRGIHRANLRVGAGRLPLLFKPNGQPEMRLLACRPDEDHVDASRLFNALLKARAIRRLRGDPPRYALARPEPSLDRLFATTVIRPEWKTDRFFHAQLEDPQFTAFVEHHYPHLDEWNDMAARLARDPRPRHVARQLANCGVLETGDAGQYRMAGPTPRNSAPLPTGPYSCRRGKLVGLTKGAFITALQRDDWFYNVMFWRAVDASALRRLTVNDVPPFLLDYVARHLG